MKFITEIKNNIGAIAFSSVVFIVFLVMFEVLFRAEAQKAEAKLKIESINYTATLQSKVDRE